MLSLIDKALFLKKSSLFSSLHLDMLLTIADKMELLSFRENEKVFSFHEETQHLYFLLQGEVSLFGERRELLAELSPGEFFGEESLFHQKPRCYEAVAVKESAILTLSRAHLFKIIAEAPSVAIHLLEIYAQALPFRPR